MFKKDNSKLTGLRLRIASNKDILKWTGLKEELIDKLLRRDYLEDTLNNSDFYWAKEFYEQSGKKIKDYDKYIDLYNEFLSINDDSLNSKEVTKPETINYKTFKAEKKGLFDELIFGPSTDFKCPICGKKYKKGDEGNICEATDECKKVKPEILPKIAKRTRMGYIKLAAPIAHIWFLKIDHSTISKLIGLQAEGSTRKYTKKQLEQIVYFKSHIVLNSGGLASLPKHKIINIQEAPVIYRNALKEIQDKFSADQDEYKTIDMTIAEIEEAASSDAGQEYGIDFYEYNRIIEEYSDAKISTGAAAIKTILEELNIDDEINRISEIVDDINQKSSSELTKIKIEERDKYFKRLKILKDFRDSNQNPANMIVEYLPVIPADLRPLIQLDGGRHSTVDVNELYRRIIIRNNRLKKWYQLDAPELIIQNEKRMLQEAVDALFDNSRKSIPLNGKDNRPLKSIADALAGKKGRFRQNLLGKRVDYSGRSVIVVGPNLKMHQAGIPRQMAAKLFEPFIVKILVEKKISNSTKHAKKLIEELNPLIWPHVEDAIKGKLVLLNRAPTLHRLSVQAFEPVLVRGKAIMLHPLSTAAFNADFDGDQMAVHVPISDEAINEARELMLGNKNILGPKDGQPIINPSQDMILGLFYLTREVKNAKGEGNIFGTYETLYKAYERGSVDLHARVFIPKSELNKNNISDEDGYVFTTVGKFMLNHILPSSFPFIFDKNSIKQDTEIPSEYLLKSVEDHPEFLKNSKINDPLKKSDISKIARKIFDEYSPIITKLDLAEVIKKIHSGNYKDSVMMLFDLFSNKGIIGEAGSTSYRICSIHAQILEKFIARNFATLNKEIMLSNENVERVFELSEKSELLDRVWFDYTNLIARVLDNIKELGFKYSMISGSSVAISDIIKSDTKHAEIEAADKYVQKLSKWTEDGIITDDERYKLTVEKWIAVKAKVEKNMKDLVKDNPYNSIFMMMESGARGAISNFVQLAGMRGLMSNNSKSVKATAEAEKLVRKVIDVPVKSSFLDGLSAFEFFSSTHGARKGLTDTALNTAESGYLTRRLVDACQEIVVKRHDCNTDVGSEVEEIVDTRTNSIIVSLLDRITGRYSNETIIDPNTNDVIVNSQELITSEIAEKIIKAGIQKVNIRSIFGCLVSKGVCKKCFGLDLSTNKEINLGEAVGIIAAQSIGEPGTQLTMRTFHTGGVASGDEMADVGGFQRLKELIDVVKKPWGKIATIAKVGGIVKSIDEKDGTTKIVVKTEDPKEEHSYTAHFGDKIRVQKSEEIVAGQKIIDGSVVLQDLLKVAGPVEVQKYLIKEIQRIYRMQGISIADKYIEIVIRQMLSKAIIIDAGDSSYYTGTLESIFDINDMNKELFVDKKKPIFFNQTIQGIKKIPLISDSFLSAASYQETSKILVKSAISSSTDNLVSLKENIILGNKIPAGTGYDYEENGKYDLRPSIDYFK